MQKRVIARVVPLLVTVASLGSSAHAQVAAAAPEPVAAADVVPETATPSSSTASPSASTRGYGDRLAVDVVAGTSFPISVGVAAIVELPFGIQVRVGLGWMPPTYLEAIDDVAVAAGWYDEATASLIEAALRNALVVDVGLGFRPFEHEGFEVFGGYTAALLGGGLGASEVVEAVAGRTLDRGSGSEVPLAAVAHAFHVGVGWRLPITDGLVVHASVAYLQIAASDAWIASDRQGAATAAASQALDQALEAELTTWVKTPLVGLALGYAFE